MAIDKNNGISRKNTAFISGLIIGCASTFTLLMLREMKLGISEQQLPSIASELPGHQCNTPQIYNFMKEFGNRDHHLDVPKILKTDLSYGKGKVIIDIGLNDGLEFFASIASGYSVYGFEANPVSTKTLREKCEEYDGKTHGPPRCMFVDAADITEHLHPEPFTSYLIGGGAGPTKAVLNMSISGHGSSFVEVAPDQRHPQYKEVTVIPVSDVVDNDVYLLKLDVQGFEYDVLKGMQKLFRDKVVKTMIMEVYPRGLGNAGTDFDEFLNFLWNDLGMLCSSSNPISDKNSFEMDHPNSLTGFAKYLNGLTNATWWGQFDDFTCFNRLKAWNEK